MGKRAFAGVPSMRLRSDARPHNILFSACARLSCSHPLAPVHSADKIFIDHQTVSKEDLQQTLAMSNGGPQPGDGSPGGPKKNWAGT
jgi:hypothetical protein